MRPTKRLAVPYIDILVDQEIKTLIAMKLIQIEALCQNYNASFVHLSFGRLIMNERLLVFVPSPFLSSAPLPCPVSE